MELNELSLILIKEKVKAKSLTVPDLRCYYVMIERNRDVPITLLVDLADVLYENIQKHDYEILYLYRIFRYKIPGILKKKMPLFMDNYVFPGLPDIISTSILCSIHVPLYIPEDKKSSINVITLLRYLDKGTPLYKKTQRELFKLVCKRN